MTIRPRVGLACNRRVREHYVAPAELSRLTGVADFCYREFSLPFGWNELPKSDGRTDAELAEFAAGLDALVVCHGSPRVTAATLDAAPSLRFVGELEGDRFGTRIDVAAAAARGVAVVDTTHGSSPCVAEWALALALIGLRDAGELAYRLRTGDTVFAEPADRAAHQAANRELAGRPVSLIGFGHIGRALVRLLAPFGVDAVVYDPYAPGVLAEAYGIRFADLATTIAHGDVVFCLVPLTPATRGMLGAEEFALMHSGSVFVNVSRGAVADSQALIERLGHGDIGAALDVFDPEPIAADSAIRSAPHTFLSPHIAGTTVESRPRFFRFMVDELLDFFAGRRPVAELSTAVLAERGGVAR